MDSDHNSGTKLTRRIRTASFLNMQLLLACFALMTANSYAQDSRFSSYRFGHTRFISQTLPSPTLPTNQSTSTSASSASQEVAGAQGSSQNSQRPGPTRQPADQSFGAAAAAKNPVPLKPPKSDSGYIENAQIRNIFRVRYDAGFDLNRPDRAEFFYASWAILGDHRHAIKDTDQIISGAAKGPLLIPESVNFQDVSTYLEVAVDDRLSVFGELPYRFVQFNGDLEDDYAFETPAFRAAYEASPTSFRGYSDTQVGIKYAIRNQPDQILTMQLRSYIPTGDSRSGLGTGHVSIEPGLLYYQKLTDNLSLAGQAKLWAPIQGGANSGNIGIYGAALSYTMYERGSFRITPVVEFLGFTVLDGYESLSSPTGVEVVPNSARIAVNPFESALSDPNDPNSTQIFQDRYTNVTYRPNGPNPYPFRTRAEPPTVRGQTPPNSGGTEASKTHGVQSVIGATIVDAKVGVRMYFSPRDDIYVGYGHALTDNRWYEDIFRVEYRFSF